jgi:hypothetical protein
MRRISTVAFVIAVLVCGSAHAQEQRRELGAHVHGAGSLNIAIDGNTVSLGLNAPGHDIVGFEHAPSNADQRLALEMAKEKLAQPLKLFELSQAAGCTVASTDVKFDTGEGEANNSKGPSDTKAGEEGKHADFDADYVINCKAADAIDQIQFRYFKLFADAEKLTVTIVTGAGQKQVEVTKASPSLSLK